MAVREVGLMFLLSGSLIRGADAPGGFQMVKKFVIVIALSLSVAAITGCQYDFVQEVPWVTAECTNECAASDHSGCGDTAFCMAIEADACGFAVTRCVEDYCEASFDSDPYTGERVKVSDSCGQGYVCNIETQMCDLLSDTPTDPEDPVEPTDDLVEVKCCYTGIDALTYFGQMAWSEATTQNPKGWGALRDLDIDTAGCFEGQVDAEKVLAGQYWVDLTAGKAEAQKWAGASKKPTSCSINGWPAQIDTTFTPNRGWGFHL